MRNEVVTRKQKYNGKLSHEWRGDLVEGNPEWLAVYYEAPVHETTTGQQVAHAIECLATHAPLVVLASFDGRGELLEYQCDACLPVTVSGRTFTWVDLDLDVIAGPDLVPRVRDFDDFAKHASAMAYPAKVIAQAEEGVNLALRMLRKRAWPFDGGAGQLLGSALAARGPL